MTVIKSVAAVCFLGICAWFGFAIPRVTEHSSPEDLFPGSAARRALLEREEDLTAKVNLKMQHIVARATASDALPSPVHDEDAESAADPEWQALPRLGFSIVETLHDQSESLEGRTLFRHKELNPHDRFICKAARDAFDTLLKKRTALLETAIDFRSDLAGEEFDRLKSRGRARFINFHEAVASIPAPQRQKFTRECEGAARERGDEGMAIIVGPLLFPGRRMPIVTNVDGDRIFYSVLEDLPAASQVEELRVHLSIDLASKVVSWFGSTVALTSDQQQQIMNALIKRIP